MNWSETRLPLSPAHSAAAASQLKPPRDENCAINWQITGKPIPCLDPTRPHHPIAVIQYKVRVSLRLRSNVSKGAVHWHSGTGRARPMPVLARAKR